jgi:hypothetical protein
MIIAPCAVNVRATRPVTLVRRGETVLPQRRHRVRQGPSRTVRVTMGITDQVRHAVNGLKIEVQSQPTLLKKVSDYAA